MGRICYIHWPYSNHQTPQDNLNCQQHTFLQVSYHSKTGYLWYRPHQRSKTAHPEPIQNPRSQTIAEGILDSAASMAAWYSIGRGRLSPPFLLWLFLWLFGARLKPFGNCFWGFCRWVVSRRGLRIWHLVCLLIGIRHVLVFGGLAWLKKCEASVCVVIYWCFYCQISPWSSQHSVPWNLNLIGFKLNSFLYLSTY